MYNFHQKGISMKSGTYKVFALISTALFILITIKVGYDFYNLTDSVVKELEIVEVGKRKALAGIVFQLGVFCAIGFFVALLAIILFNISASSNFMEAVRLDNNALQEKKEEMSEVQKNAKNAIGLSALGEVNKILTGFTGEERLEKILRLVCKNIEACQGAIYALKKEGRKQFYTFQVGYAYYLPESQAIKYEVGEGLVGQVGKDGSAIILKSVPEGYMQVISGLGQASPKSLLLVPIFSKNNEVMGVFEIASFTNFTELQKSYVQQVANLLSEQMTDSLVVA